MSFEPETENEYAGLPEVAVIGMAGRFPAADDLQAFWRILREGREAIRRFSPDELRAAGIPDEEIADPAYVPAFGSLNDVEHFDASFFGYSPREAEALEPAHRIFLECCWEALEDGGVDPVRAAGPIGVFAGAGTPFYTEENVRRNPDVAAAVGEFQMAVGSGKDFLATRASYKLDLRGPSMSVQTGCSTSLVAVHAAAQALLHRECDLALAGGANVVTPNHIGYLYSPGGISSPDGHCRAFDAGAQGTLGGSGVGVVLLKRLEDAVRDGDPIRAVIKGSAVNNDGGQKIAFTAPSVAGQAAVIREALEVADVDPSTIRYVEGHGSGTELGDPIEIAALTQAWRGWTDRRQFAAVGSVKTNIGHLDAAAGIAGFVKTVLALEMRELPPTVHFRSPNPGIDFASSPFYVANRLEVWDADGSPRRAAVSSFGIGGTNAHVVLQEAPPVRSSRARRETQLLVVSAKTPAALDAATERLAAHLRGHPEQPLAEVAWTLQAGRREMGFRRTLVVRSGEDAAALLQARHPERITTAAVEDGHRSVAFMFPGVGEQYPRMARGLYDSEPAFRAEVDRCAELLRPMLGIDIREVVFPGGAPAEAPAGPEIDLRAMLGRSGSASDETARLNRTELAQPAVFVIEYALARLLMGWGIIPEAVAGHSLGEYAAACVAGIFSLEDALALVAERARLIGALPGGAMLAVPLSPEATAGFLAEGTAIATVNAPELCVVAGAEGAVDEVRRRLADAGHVARKLAATHAFHSPMMDPALGAIEALVARMGLSAPRIPMISNVTGTWITAAEATDPRYWARHTRETVRFDLGAAELLRGAGRVLVEVGPGQTLSTFIRQRGDAGAVPVIPTVRYPYDRTQDAAFLLGALGRLWLAGVTPDWAAFHEGERLNRVRLPTYPWQRQRYWIDAPRPGQKDFASLRGGRRSDPAEWLYVPTWRRTAALRPEPGDGRVLVFADDSPLAAGAIDALRAHGRTPVVVRPGERFGPAADGWRVRPGSREDHRKLADALAPEGGIPPKVLHLWGIADAGTHAPIGVLVLADALGRTGAKLDLLAATTAAAEVTGEDAVDAVRAALFGTAAVLRMETPPVTTRVADVSLADSERDRRAMGARLAAEALAGEERVVALRGRHRWVRGIAPVKPAPAAVPVPREGGVYLLIGGLRGRNELLARHLVRRHGARLVLVDSTLPPRGSWDAVIKARLPEDPLRRQLERVRAMEADGAEILTLQALPGEAEQVRDALRDADSTFGAVHGVVFAPLANEEAPRQSVGEVRVAPWERRMTHLLDELHGVRAALSEREMDFVLVESSLTPVLGGIGVIDTAATHAVIDAFAAATAQDATPWTSTAWDRWFGEGEPAEGFGMDEADATAAFEHLLTWAGEPHVLLSTGDVEERMAARVDDAAGPAIGSYARPKLATEYYAPSTDIEEVVAGMWEELLGISPIGVHDDFFALGGHSLLATQIISRCRDGFGLELPLKAIFEAPTIARFATLVEDAIVAEIDALTDEEALELAGA